MKDLLKIRAMQCIQAAVMKIIQFPCLKIDPLDTYGGLFMLAMIARITNIGQIKSIEFDQHQAITSRLDLDMLRQTRPDLKFLHINAIEQEEIMQRKLKKCPLVALKLSCQRKGKAG